MSIERNLCPAEQCRLVDISFLGDMPQETFVVDKTHYSIYQSLLTLQILISQIHGMD